MSKPQLLLSNADGGMQLSAEDYAEADFQPPWRYERALGRLIVNPPPSYDHYLVAEHFRDYLVGYKLEHRDIVDHVFEESWLTVDQDADRRPDIAVYLHSASDSGQMPQRVPDLIYEIVSPGPDAHDRDYTDKRAEYERRGVQEYVIVDRFEHCLTVLRLVNGRYAEHVLQAPEEYTTPLLPGLKIPLEGVI